MDLIYKKKNQIEISNHSNDDFEFIEISNSERISFSVRAKNDIQLIQANYNFRFELSKNDKIFLNGYQSWTDSFEYSLNSKFLDAAKHPSVLNKKWAFKNYGDAHFYEYQKNILHGWDVSYVKGSNEIFIGNLNYKNAYLIIQFKKKNGIVNLKSDISGINLKAGEEFIIFDFIISNNIENGKNEYFKNFTCRTDKKLFGYTSWYNHYQNINEKLIVDALEASPSDFDLFQIDDGFEEYVGDWLKIDKNKFPNGLEPVVKKIHERNFLAGIWLAPFAAEEKSALFKEHKDWFVKNSNGELIKAGGNWSGFYALDLNNPEALAYIKTVLEYYKNLNFDFFKLDFLYAASIVPLPGLTRAQTARKAYELLREILGDKLILGCGAVFSSSFELFDYMRIGPDVSLKFDDVWYMKKLLRERISTKITLRNTIYRSIFNGKTFQNDPDVFLLRKHNIKLSEKQKESLFLINALFGSLLMTSDNPKHYEKEQFEKLEKNLRIFKEGKVLSYETSGNKILINYSDGKDERKICYDIRRGCLE